MPLPGPCRTRLNPSNDALMNSLTDPLDLQGRLTPPDRRLDPVPLLDVILIALLLFGLSSHFIYAPGLTVDVKGEAGEQPVYTLDLPVAEQDRLPGQPVASTVTVGVLTARQENMFLFDGQIHTLTSLKGAMQASNRAGRYDGAVLLLKMDRSVSIQTFLTLSEYAALAGFSRVQLAAGHEEPAMPDETKP